MAEVKTDAPSPDPENWSDTMSEMASDQTTTESDKRPESILIGPGAAAAVVPTAPARHRPIMVTILAIGAGLLAVLSAVHLLQALGILPFVIGRFELRAFSFFHAIM